MPRNIVICCDGTNNQFGVCNTSVVRLVEVAVRDPLRQIVYYDPGVGTLPDARFISRIGQKLSTFRALALATDLHDKIEIAYRQLMELWEPGDRVYLFGFSRGAYTVRVLAALLHNVGLLPRGNSQLVPYALRLFSSLRKDKGNFYWNVLEGFRWSFAQEVPGRSDRRFPVAFLGVWDTVSSVGWAWDPARYPNSAHNPSIRRIRHAVSIDERRWFFRQNLIVPDADPNVQDITELWFAGVHSDVGGGYPEEDGGLWRVTFEWMLQEARAASLIIDESRLATIRSKTQIPARPWAEPQHESLRGASWWLAEFFPKLVYRPSTKRSTPGFGLGHHRYVHEGALIHRSVLERITETAYRPPNLSNTFIETVRNTSPLPETMPYMSGR